MTSHLVYWFWYNCKPDLTAEYQILLLFIESGCGETTLNLPGVEFAYTSLVKLGNVLILLFNTCTMEKDSK